MHLKNSLEKGTKLGEKFPQKSKGDGDLRGMGKVYRKESTLNW